MTRSAANDVGVVVMFRRSSPRTFPSRRSSSLTLELREPERDSIDQLVLPLSVRNDHALESCRTGRLRRDRPETRGDWLTHGMVGRVATASATGIRCDRI